MKFLGCYRDWRESIIEYLKNPSQQVSRKLKYKALKFVLLDDHLYRRTIDGVLLKCLKQEETKVLMGEIQREFVVKSICS